jgi:uncharacterized RDD family membrane protein YckC
MSQRPGSDRQRDERPGQPPAQAQRAAHARPPAHTRPSPHTRPPARTQPPASGHPPAYAGLVPLTPGMGRRLTARLIDGVLVGLVVAVLVIALFGGAATGVRTDRAGNVTSGGGRLVAAYLASASTGFVVTLLYEVCLIATRGATLGKHVMRLKVVREADGAAPGLGPSVLRWLLPQAAGFLTVGLATVLVYVSPLLDGTGRRQGWHDKVAGTRVVSSRPTADGPRSAGSGPRR